MLVLINSFRVKKSALKVLEIFSSKFHWGDKTCQAIFDEDKPFFTRWKNKSFYNFNNLDIDLL